MKNIMNDMILEGGRARSYSMEAIALARNGRFTRAEEKLECAVQAINKAHHLQTSLIQREAAGAKNDVSLLMIHAQDHLMNAMTVKDLALELVDLYQVTNKVERKQQHEAVIETK